MTEPPFGFSLPPGMPDPNDPEQLAQLMAQLQHMFGQGGDAPVNWDLARQVAQSQLEGGPAGFSMGMPGMGFGASADLPEAAPPAPPVTDSDRTAIAEALRLADIWLEPETALPSGVGKVEAWTPAQWVSSTLPVWERLCDPVAGRMVTAMTEALPMAPETNELGPMVGVLRGLGSALFGGLLGQALATLAGEVLSSSDIGLPLAPSGTAALLPNSISTYGDGLELPADEVRIYVALREAAHHRLFGHVPWLRNHVLSAVESYAAGIKISQEAIEEAMGRLDPERPESMQEVLIEGAFANDDTPAQKAALARLETVLALIEGWVTHVADRAADGRLPSLVRLGEAFRRRRAEGGPAEQTFAALVGLELRPRRLREAAALWTALTEAKGVSGRDEVWAHPDLLPTDEDFSEPDEFAARGYGLDLDLSFPDPAPPEAESPNRDEDPPPAAT